MACNCKKKQVTPQPVKEEVKVEEVKQDETKE